MALRDLFKSMPTDALVCPRCSARSGRSIGNAGSLLTWYTCATCHHVWAPGAPPRAAEPEPETRVAASGHRQHVLVVDDDVLMLSIVERMLAAYRVSTARDGHEALAILSSADAVDLLITDYLMPGMTGSELVKRAREVQSDLPVLVITGHGHTLVTADPVWWSGESHVEKPFRVKELLQGVEKLIGPPR